MLVAAALAVGGYAGWRHWHHASGPVATPRPTCTPRVVTTTTVAVGPPVQVLNGSLRPGLAARAAAQLHRRFGFAIGRVGNAVAFQRGASVVRYPAALAGEAQRLAAAVVPPARLVVGSAPAVELDIGTRFRSVAAAPAPVTPSPSPCGAA